MKKKNIKTGTLTGQEMKVCISDEKSHREVDENGRLIIHDTLITKESVDPYYGSEIPGYEEFGLEPNKVYHIYRPATELKKAIKKFDGVPVLDTHIMDNPGAERKENRVGSVSNSRMDGGAVFADLSIWDQDAIDKINSGEKRELSAGYSADTYFKPAEFNGEHYDLIMKNLSINHIALVRRGRVPGAMVYDEKPNLKETEMSKEEILALLEPELEAAGLEKAAVEKIVLKVKEYKAEEKPETPDPKAAEPQPEAPGDKTEEPKQEEAKEEVKEEVKEEIKTEDQNPAPVPGKEPEAKADEPAPAAEEKEEIKEEVAEKKEEVKIQDMPEFQAILKEAVKAAIKELEEARNEVEDVCGKMAAMDSAADYYKAGCSYFGLKTDRDPNEFKTLFEGAKAGMAKATPSAKKAVLDENPEQPDEEPEFLKNLPKRKY